MLLGLLFVACVQAEDNRYKAWIDDNVLYRFDNQSAEICKLIKPPSGPAVWVKCDVVEPKAPPGKVAVNQIPVARMQQELGTPLQASMSRTTPAVLHTPVTQPLAALEGSGAATEPTPKKAAGGRIELFNYLDVNITDEIDDQMRAESRATINGDDKLNVSHNFKINGDHN